MAEPPAVSGEPRAGGPRAVHSAEIFCDSCQKPTSHRILRLDPPPSKGPVGPIQGVARCRECRLTHRFRTESPRPVDLDVIVSEGARSARQHVQLPRRLRLSVEAEVPELAERYRILRIDTLEGRRVPAAWSEEVATLWVTNEIGALVPVSIVEGRRTRSLKVQFPPELRLAVAGAVRIEERDYEVSAVRARGHTWRELGDGFPAREVVRLYVRRTFTPPAGRSAWSRDREIPSSEARATSSSGRSRSSPGTTRTLTRPRDRRADGGAAHQSSAP
jgi:uncharacterized Zn finger protein